MENIAKPAKTLVPVTCQKRDINKNKKNIFFIDVCAPPTSISECDHKCILEHVVVEVVVGGKSHDSSPTDRQRVEGLSSCIFPHLYDKQEISLKVILLPLFSI